MKWIVDDCLIEEMDNHKVVNKEKILSNSDFTTDFFKTDCSYNFYIYKSVFSKTFEKTYRFVVLCLLFTKKKEKYVKKLIGKSILGTLFLYI